MRFRSWPLRLGCSGSGSSPDWIVTTQRRDESWEGRTFDLTKGQEYRFSAPTSTSADVRIANDFIKGRLDDGALSQDLVTWEIHEGGKARTIIFNPAEREVLLSPGTRVKIREIIEDVAMPDGILRSSVKSRRHIAADII